MIISLFIGERGKIPRRVELSWEDLREELQQYVPTPCTLATCLREKCPHKKTKAWSPATWPEVETRQKKTVDQLSCLVIDRDHVPPAELDEDLARFAGHDYFMHSSHSDSPEDRCVRVVLRTSRPVSGKEWPRFWRAAVDYFGVKADENCKDASRLYYRPSRPSDAAIDAFDGTGFDFDSNDGAPVDVDAILALAPPEVEHISSPAHIPEFRGAPSPEAYAIAVQALGEAWPDRNRHPAQLALAGALARAGWPVELVAGFCSGVAEIQEPGNGSLDKRLAAARSSIEKLEAGDAVVGWPTVAQYVGDDAVAAATRALGIGVGLDSDPELFAGLEAMAERRREAGGTPTRLELRTAIEKARDAGKKSKDTAVRHASKLLSKILKGEFLTEHADEDRARTLCLAALAVIRALPPGTSAPLIHEFLLGPAGELACDVPEIVEEALAHLARSRERVEVDDKDLPDPGDDDELREQLILTDKGGVAGCGSNIERVLRFSQALKGNVRFNLLSKQIEVTGGRFQSETVGGLPVGVKNWLSSHWSLAASTSEAAEQILRIAQTWCAYDPVAEYLRALTWDAAARVGGLEHVSWLTTYLGVEDSPYVRKVGARFLISAVARALDPGCKVDTVLVLEGEQGVKKSTTVGILGRPWSSSTPIVMGDKDSRLLAASKWICELAELASITKGDIESYKAFLSQQHDDFRPPYGRAMESFPRRCVFFGSTNDHEYLQDQSGNRRWWAVRTERCDAEALERDRDQLWAEAVRRYLSAELHPEESHAACPGERWWFELDEQLEADAVAGDRMIDNPWVDMIEDFLAREARPTGTKSPRVQFSLAEIAEHALKMNATEARRNDKLIVRAMRASGMEKVPGRPGAGARGRLWQRKGALILGTVLPVTDESEIVASSLAN
jgi:predicted P-loop ATPase